MPVPVPSRVSTLGCGSAWNDSQVKPSVFVRVGAVLSRAVNWLLVCGGAAAILLLWLFEYHR